MANHIALVEAKWELTKRLSDRPYSFNPSGEGSSHPMNTKWIAPNRQMRDRFTRRDSTVEVGSPSGFITGGHIYGDPNQDDTGFDKSEFIAVTDEFGSSITKNEWNDGSNTYNLFGDFDKNVPWVKEGYSPTEFPDDIALLDNFMYIKNLNNPSVQSTKHSTDCEEDPNYIQEYGKSFMRLVFTTSKTGPYVNDFTILLPPGGSYASNFEGVNAKMQVQLKAGLNDSNRKSSNKFYVCAEIRNVI